MMGPNSAFKSEILDNLDDLTDILKVLANKRRLRILAELSEGAQTFQTLLNVIPLQKTALSNHLSSLLDMDLIDKPDYGKYKITRDGRSYLRSLLNMWSGSVRYSIKKMERVQEKAISDAFFNSFFH